MLANYTNGDQAPGAGIEPALTTDSKSALLPPMDNPDHWTRRRELHPRVPVLQTVALLLSDAAAERRGHDPQPFPTHRLSKPCCSLNSLLSIGGSRRSRTPAGFPTSGFQDQCPTTRASASGVTRGTCILFFRSTI